VLPSKRHSAAHGQHTAGRRQQSWAYGRRLRRAIGRRGELDFGALGVRTGLRLSSGSSRARRSGAITTLGEIRKTTRRLAEKSEDRFYGSGVTWATANTASTSTNISTTSNSSRTNFAQGSSGRARIGYRSESLGVATTKLESWRSALATPFQGGNGTGGGQFRRRRHAIGRSLCETDDPRIDPHARWRGRRRLDPGGAQKPTRRNRPLYKGVAALPRGGAGAPVVGRRHFGQSRAGASDVACIAAPMTNSRRFMGSLTLFGCLRRSEVARSALLIRRATSGRFRGELAEPRFKGSQFFAQITLLDLDLSNFFLDTLEVRFSRHEFRSHSVGYRDQYPI
jgi:hypothetical protein